MLDHIQRRYYCFRLYAFSDYDEELVWADVQSYGGRLSIKVDCIDFFVPADYASFFVLKWPDLTRQRNLEYV